MERGKFKIEVNDAGNISVNIELIDGTVWLTKHEIASQFRVFVPAVTANLRTIFKSRELLEDDVVKLYRFTRRKGEKVSIDLYNLDVIIALSFRMNGAICLKFRIWVQEKIKQPIVQHHKIPMIIQLGNTFLPC
ncbi:MAG: hypothetical protein ABFC28_05560 [Rikenellaceae bacterium]